MSMSFVTTQNNAGQVKLKCLCKNNLHFTTDFFFFRTDVDMLLDDIVSKEPLITPSKMEQVRKLIISILYFCFLYCISQCNFLILSISFFDTLKSIPLCSEASCGLMSIHSDVGT